MLHSDLGRLIEIEDRRDWSSAALEAYCGMKVYFVLWAALDPLDYHERTAKGRSRGRMAAWKEFSKRYLDCEPVGEHLARQRKTPDLASASALKAQVVADTERRACRNNLSLADEIRHYVERRDRRMAPSAEAEGAAA